MFRTRSKKHQILRDYMCTNIIYRAAVIRTIFISYVLLFAFNSESLGPSRRLLICNTIHISKYVWY